MPHIFSPKILTANHLQRGVAIYWAATGWVDSAGDALLFEDANSAAQALEQASTQPEIAVGPYLADAMRGLNDRPVPSHFRESFRARGPSNYRHGKQEQANV